MPVVSIFFGIVIRMFHREHPPAHFHASYQGFEALVAIEDGAVIAGNLPHKAMRIVQDWRVAHRQALLDNWQLGSAMLPMEMIPGADLDD